MSNHLPQPLGHCMRVPIWFYSTHISKTETCRDGKGQGRKADSTESSHIARVIAVECDLLCGQTKQVLPVKKCTASPLRISPAFPPSSIHFDDSSHLSSSPHLTPQPRTVLAATPALCSCMCEKCRPRPLCLTPTAMHTLRASPSSCAVLHHQLDTSH